MELLFVLMAVTAAAWFAAALIGWLDQLAYPPLPAGVPDEQTLAALPHVTVIIPARNEELNIEGCVLSVLNQAYPNLGLIVVDDQSTDRTPELLAEMANSDERLLVIRGQALPQGWIGKGWALYQGHRRAEGDWLVLLDADVRLEPWAIAQTVAYGEQRNVDFVNPYPKFINVTFWEKVLQPLLWGLVRLRFPLIWVNRDWAPENMAFGPLIAIRKRVYDALGGHKHVAMDILEDVALARMARKRGYRTRVLNGKRIFRIRMYRNLQDLLDGWTKTAFGAMHYNLGLMAVAVAGLFWAATQPVISLLIAPGLPPAWQAVVALQAGGMLIRRMVDARENGFGFTSIALHPLGMLMVHYMQVRAVWKYYFGSFQWKGRDYAKPRPADPHAGEHAPTESEDGDARD